MRSRLCETGWQLSTLLEIKLHVLYTFTFQRCVAKVPLIIIIYNNLFDLVPLQNHRDYFTILDIAVLLSIITIINV